MAERQESTSRGGGGYETGAVFSGYFFNSPPDNDDCANAQPA